MLICRECKDVIDADKAPGRVEKALCRRCFKQGLDDGAISDDGCPSIDFFGNQVD
jgi:hypothetical protein